MSMTYEQGRAGVIAAIEHLRPLFDLSPGEFDRRLEYELSLYDSAIQFYEPQFAFYDVVNLLAPTAHNSYIFDMGGDYLPSAPDPFWDAISGAETIAFFYPDAVNAAAIIQQLDSNVISGADLMYGLAATGFNDDSLTAEQIQYYGSLVNDDASILDKYTDLPSPTYGQGSDLLDAGLSFNGLTDDQLDFMIAMYIGAFSRAPDFNGLEFWANGLVGAMASGKPFEEAILDISQSFYDAGARNGEIGTDMSATQYVERAYDNVLGRLPDSGGLSFWSDSIEAGAVSKGHFLVRFIEGATASIEDSSHITQLVAVGEFMAQEHVSGGNKADAAFLASLLDIIDTEPATEIISDIIQEYGSAPQGMSDIQIVGASSSTDDMSLFIS